MIETYTTHGPEETVQIARKIAAKMMPGTVVILSGDLGSGKTCFLKGVVSYFGIREKDVSSPTFTLVNEYISPEDFRILHADAYRVESDLDWDRLALLEELNEQSLVLIEWGEKFKHLIHEPGLHIHIHLQGETDRQIEVLPIA